jgi:hypothetical protein
MNFPALIFLALIAWSVTVRPGILVALLLASMPFASLALLPPEIVGGMSILPQSMFAVVLIIKVLAPEAVTVSPKLLKTLQFRQLGYLALFLLLGILEAVIMPRLFLGEVVIIPMRDSWSTELLSPIQANFTQSGYMTLSVMTAFAVTLIADEPQFAETLLAGMLAGGIVCIATGLIDFAAASVGMESLLDPFRNAGYAQLNNADVGGIRRVVGFTPEASVYGPICVQFATSIALLRHLYTEGRQRILATMVVGGLLIMALLSTSSTAYAGLAVFGLVYTANWIRRLVSSSPWGKRGTMQELLVGLGVMITLLFVIIARADLFDPLLDLVNEVVLNKPLSSSFFERSLWNTVAWNTVAATWGLGVGFGSTRTSSWFVAIISNTGLIGAALMGIFLVQIFSKRPSWRTLMSVEMLPALKLSLLPGMAMGIFAAPGPDIGPWSGIVLGAITGIAALRPERGSVRHIAAGKPMALAGERATIGGRAFSRLIRPTPLRRRHQDIGSEKPARGP